MSIPAEFKSFVGTDGRIKRLPVKQGKKVALSQWLLTLLEPGVVYSEKQVNDLFFEYVDDFALMRRMLVDAGELLRDRYGYEYQRPLLGA